MKRQHSSSPLNWRGLALISIGLLSISIWYLATGPAVVGFVFLALAVAQAVFAANSYVHVHEHHRARPHHPRYHSHFHI